MNDKLTSILVLRSHYQAELATKPFVDKHGLVPCQILDSTAPYYLRLKVELPCGEPDAVQAEILLPHDAVLLILIDAPNKTLGFGFPAATRET